MLFQIKSVCLMLLTFVFYLADFVLSLLKFHLQVVQWHSELFIWGTGAGWNLLFKLFRSFTVCHLIPVHPSLPFSFGCFWSCWGPKLGLVSCGFTSLSCLRAGALWRKGVFTDRGRPGEGRWPTLYAGLARKGDRRRFAAVVVLRLLPALLQGVQVAWPQGGCRTLERLWEEKQNVSMPNLKWKQFHKHCQSIAIVSSTIHSKSVYLAYIVPNTQLKPQFNTMQ